jgi:hypothetical protein
MKTFTLLLFILISFSASALEVSFTGPCSERPLLTEVIKFAPGLNAGEVSLHVLDRNRIPYKGTTAGLNQVFDTSATHSSSIAKLHRSKHALQYFTIHYITLKYILLDYGTADV